MTGHAARPFRFGIGPSGLPDEAAEWRPFARRLEDLGYGTLHVGDHLDRRLGPVAAMAVAAEATTTLRIGALVLANDYRHPAVLAKELTTIDALSGGRLEIGVGAGWMRTDYERAGLAFDPTPVRVERLAETVAVLRGLSSGERWSFAGRHYRIDGMRGFPPSVQRPHPPILIGGGGRRILELAARTADIVGINVALRSGALDATIGRTATGAATAEKLKWIREAAGDRFPTLELEVYVHDVAVVDGPSERDDAARRFGDRVGLPPEAVLTSPHFLVGTVGELVDRLQLLREETGITYVGLSGDHADALAPVVERLVPR